MAGSLATGWEADLGRFLEPFLAGLSRAAQRCWAPVYVTGLLLPGERKSVEPMAQRVAPGDVQQLHHFISTAPWPTAPLEAELVRQADRLVGGADAVLVIDDTALVKQGKHSVGVQRQYCGQLGKRANCQALVSLTLARQEVPVCVGLRLFLPEAWAAANAEACRRAGVPAAILERGHQPKWRIALDEIERIAATGARFGCVLADAEYGKAAVFRRELSARGHLWALGVLPTQKVYPAEVTLSPPTRSGSGSGSGRGRGGRPAKHPVPSVESVGAAERFEALPPEAFRTITSRQGTKGSLQARFAALRVRVADGPPMAQGRHLPNNDEAWLVCEWRTSGERKYHLTNHPAETPLERLAAQLKQRWACEQMHQQMKEELGLDHFEGRSWTGLHHHTLMCQIAFAFLQHLRLRPEAERDDGEKNRRRTIRNRATARAVATGSTAADQHGRVPDPAALPTLPKTLQT